MSHKSYIANCSIPGMIIALGIIYGDIGTSPLYVFNAICGNNIITSDLILGSLSCIIWTLTIQTTIKYVVLTLRADNHGEGGIFSLYALIRRYSNLMVYPAMIGGVALLADGIITPPMTVVSAIEGLRLLPALHNISQNNIVTIVIFIISILFFAQQFGTNHLGKAFGPLMLIWFLMLGVLGVSSIGDNFHILKSFNPYYAIKFLMSDSMNGFLILGAVFLCTTGAEALYSDLGHVGRANIRVSWVFVKICLLLNYLGQGAYLLNHVGTTISNNNGLNPFFSLMPAWFLPLGLIIATLAAIVASQALISGSFTLIGEAMRLNLWPKLKIKYPTEEKGQIYIPLINYFMWGACLFMIITFRSSSNMEAAYGLSICFCMIMTSILFSYYMMIKRVNIIFISLYMLVYFIIETNFLLANIFKFFHGGYVVIIMGGVLFMITYVWYQSRKIRNRYAEFVDINKYIPYIRQLSEDEDIPLNATHLAFMVSSNIRSQVEYKVLYSIFNRKPKRADIYWFVHVDTTDEPFGQSYKLTTYDKNNLYRIDFKLGFRVQPRIDLFFREIVQELKDSGEIYFENKYENVLNNRLTGDYRFVVIEKFLSNDNELPFFEKLIMRLYFLLKGINISEERNFGLDLSNVRVEKFPLIIAPIQKNINLHRKQ